MTLSRCFASLLALALRCQAASAAYDLRITEIWMGNEPGENLSEDWIEITNFGSTAWTAATDGQLWFDDDSFDATTADMLMGVASIAPGESVVFVDGLLAGLNEFTALWSPVVTLGQVGNYEGAGLGQGGDAVGIWISPTQPTVGTAPNFTAGYPDANRAGGASWDAALGAFSSVGNASGAVATTTLNDAGQPAIGSPGSVVPEPAGLGLIAAGLLGLLAARRR